MLILVIWTRRNPVVKIVLPLSALASSALVAEVVVLDHPSSEKISQSTTGTPTNTPLSQPPAPELEWERFFSTHQRMVTRSDFFDCLESLVSSRNLPSGFIVDKGSSVVVQNTTGREYELFFAATRPSTRRAGRYWRHPAEVIPANRTQPLSGARIAIDPGHIGGEWAAREGRLFHAKCGTRIAEGDMNLEVAQVLKALLEQAGARVWLTRKNAQPLHGSDPSIFNTRARENLKASGRPINPASVARESDRLLLQVAEIEARAEIVNAKIKPDMVICLHFNAEPWGSGRAPQMSSRNHMHVLVGGSYLADELSDSAARLDLLRRVVEGTHVVEIPLARAIAAHLSSETGLPPFSYGESSRIATSDPGSPFVWKRNLMATRTFHCPVIYPEPFVMNNLVTVAAVATASKQSWCRASAKQDIFGQYARGVYKGIVEYWISRLPHTLDTARPDFQPRRPSSPYSPRWLD